VALLKLTNYEIASVGHQNMALVITKKDGLIIDGLVITVITVIITAITITIIITAIPDIIVQVIRIILHILLFIRRQLYPIIFLLYQIDGHTLHMDLNHQIHTWALSMAVVDN
jgi:hypothetical protein